MRVFADNCDKLQQKSKAFAVNVISERTDIMIKYYNDYMTPIEVADEFGIALTTVYNLLRSGELPGFKVGKKWFVLREKMERMMY